MTIYSILGLAFKMPFSFIINSAIAPIGATFTLICLVTGSFGANLCGELGGFGMQD